MSFGIVVLAAGRGTRMCSQLPKVLHRLADKPILQHLLEKLTILSPQKLVVVLGHQASEIQNYFAIPRDSQDEKYTISTSIPSISWVYQSEQLGTSHAVLQALPELSDQQRVLVLLGDVPLIAENLLQQLIEKTPLDAIGMVTAHFPDPKGLGRIIRDEKNQVIAIIEEKDANLQQKNIQEINTGIMLLPVDLLKKWLPEVQNINQQQEYYLTALIHRASVENIAIHTITAPDWHTVLGVNTREQLAELERYYQRQQAKQFLARGVKILDPARFDLRGVANIGEDTTIDINVILTGKVNIGKNCIIGAGVLLSDVTLGDNVTIHANSVLQGAIVADGAVIGPFARLRPETCLGKGVHIGNFVEVKKSSIASETKINHLSYIGDAMIGSHVNIGAGTITCNYDGAYKHATVIEDRVFIGSDTQLVAPVTVGFGATVGAGTTITQNVQAETLVISRVPQRAIQDWQRPKKI